MRITDLPTHWADAGKSVPSAVSAPVDAIVAARGTYTGAELARIYGVSRRTIVRILERS